MYLLLPMMRSGHRRQQTAWVHEFELAAQRRIGVNAVVIDVVDARPPLVRLEFVGMARDEGLHFAESGNPSASARSSTKLLAPKTFPKNQIAVY